MTIEMSDAELARQIGSGVGATAEGELIRRMAPRIRLYGLRHLRDEHAAGPAEYENLKSWPPS